MAILTKVYGGVVTDVTYAPDGGATYSVRLSAADFAAGGPQHPEAPIDRAPGGQPAEAAQSGA